MNANDKRHGSVAGYRAGCRGACCRRAISSYNEMRKVKKSRGLPTSLLVDATGTRRRVQALVALGWSMTYIADLAQIQVTYLRFILRENKQVTADTAAKVAECYRRLSMTPPPMERQRQRQSATRARRMAESRGWAPPLAWDDIDNDEAPNVNQGYARDGGLIDEVAVQRFLHGDHQVPLTRAERRAVVIAWEKAGHPLNELERRTGWNVARMKRQVAA